MGASQSLSVVECEPCVQKTEGFADHRFDAFAEPPPLVRVVVAVHERDDSDLAGAAECATEAEPASTCVGAFGEQVERVETEAVFLAVIAEGDGGAEGAVAVFDLGGDGRDDIGGQAHADEGGGGAFGGGAVLDQEGAPFVGAAGGEQAFVGTPSEFCDRLLHGVIRQPAFHDQGFGGDGGGDGEERVCAKDESGDGEKEHAGQARDEPASGVAIGGLDLGHLGGGTNLGIHWIHAFWSIRFVGFVQEGDWVCFRVP